jgi:hypothetical protein
MTRFLMALSLGVLGTTAVAAAELPDAVAAKGEVILQAHAVGAQIYECKLDAGGKPTWQFREPIASLLRDGKTVGRHYAGPTWEIEGSAITGKVSGRAPGASAKDIPWLRLDVADRRGEGPLGAATSIQRINTSGGNLDGSCEKAGDLRAEPYSADYVFLKKSSD